MSLFEELNGAVFSGDGRYRYRLWRIWDPSVPPAVFVMLNPSIANDYQNDPTVERCQRHAMAMGCGGIRVANIFALVSTDPKGLYNEADPVGPENDAAILQSITDAGVVICAWGAHGNYRNRGHDVLALIRHAGVVPHFLKLNADGTPKHPLYVSYSDAPQPWI